ncbi:hypothetical protein O181_036289 [Austropuccinia psidii MF-1]|uniref:Uncharacterized protein n=1 Tax=Austropuccinia psidii MF-1 TaxID=1389203 RepID=A0A9Q3D4E3_9BASI|nr:hypothetical protein [Austropuccinia psidii MF-1]
MLWVMRKNQAHTKNIDPYCHGLQTTSEPFRSKSIYIAFFAVAFSSQLPGGLFLNITFPFSSPKNKPSLDWFYSSKKVIITYLTCP